MVAAQGGDARQIDDPALLPQAPCRITVESPCAGYLAAIDAERVGRAAVRLGAGRARKGEVIDPSVGFVLHAKVGDRIEQGQPLVEVHARSSSAAESARAELLSAYCWSDEPVTPPPLLLGTVARPDATATSTTATSTTATSRGES
jgi:pyrimidine-nucleoside phosphorylase